MPRVDVSGFSFGSTWKDSEAATLMRSGQAVATAGGVYPSTQISAEPACARYPADVSAANIAS